MARLLTVLSVSGCSSPRTRLLAPSTSQLIRCASACFPWFESDYARLLALNDSHSRTGLLGDHRVGRMLGGAVLREWGECSPASARRLRTGFLWCVSGSCCSHRPHRGPGSAACQRKPTTISTHSLSAELQLLGAIPDEPAASNGTAMPAQQPTNVVKPTCAEPSELAWATAVKRKHARASRCAWAWRRAAACAPTRSGCATFACAPAQPPSNRRSRDGVG